MPRETDGTYTLPTGTVTPAVTGTAISSVDFNALVDDIAATLQDSLSRTGDGGMEVPLKFAGGTDAAPGITFDGDTDTGLFSDVANEVAVAAGGTESARFTATGVEIPGVLDVENVVEAGRDGFQESASSATFSLTGSAATTAVTDGANPLTFSISTTGRPVAVGLQTAGGSSPGGILLTADAGGTRTCSIIISRDAAPVARFSLSALASGTMESLGCHFIDAPAAGGPYVYTVDVDLSDAAATINVTSMKLYGYEL